MKADLFKHATDLAVASFDQSDLIPGIFLLAYEVNLGWRSLYGKRTTLDSGLLLAALSGESGLRRQIDAGTQPIDLFIRRMSADLHHVSFRDVRLGVRQLRHEFAVVGQQQKAF
jgi:hypothetical protein